MNVDSVTHDRLSASDGEARVHCACEPDDSHRSFASVHGATLKEILSLPPQFDEPLSQHTTMRVGGPASAFVTVTTVLELKRLLSYLREHRLPYYVLGNGSNVLFPSRGFDGVVMQLGRPFEFCQIHGHKVIAGGGLLLSTLARQTSAAGLTGLEFGCGIPGTVGGSLVGNAGAGPESMGDSVTFVDLLDWNSEVRRFCKDELPFSYRKSNLAQLGPVVLRAGFHLDKTAPEVSKEKIAWLCHYRAESQPLRFASSGCVFKNPVHATMPETSGQPMPSAGALIDRAGLKGLRVGEAEVSTVHANFIINRGGATSDDVLELIRRINIRVQARFGIELEMEVRTVES